MPSALTRVGLAALLMVILAPRPSLGSSDQVHDAARRAANYLVTRQQPTGSFFTSDANTGSSGGAAEVVVSLVAAGVSGEPISSALGYVAKRGPQDATRAAYAGRIVLGLIAARRDPRNFEGFDYVDRLQSFYNQTTGSYDQGIYGNALAAIAASAAGVKIPEESLRYLTGNQCPSGGFSHQEGCLEARGADVDTTALVINFFALHREPADPTLKRARDFLLSARNSSGGFGLYAGDITNANSTSLALSAIAALGETPSGTGWASGGKDPRSQLLALQEHSGAFQFVSGVSDRRKDYATVQAIPGILGSRFPVLPSTSDGATAQSQTLLKTEGRNQVFPGPSVTSLPSSTAPAVTSSVQPAGDATAAVVVEDLQHKDSYCLSITEKPITGVDALKRLPLPVTTRDFGGGLGVAICKIGTTGNSPTNCPGSRGHWHFWEFSSAGWTEASQGPSLTVLSPGGAHGWVWTSGSVSRPPSITSPIASCEQPPAAVVQQPVGAEPGPRRTPLIALLASIASFGAVAARRIRKGGRVEEL